MDEVVLGEMYEEEPLWRDFSAHTTEVSAESVGMDRIISIGCGLVIFFTLFI